MRPSGFTLVLRNQKKKRVLKFCLDMPELILRPEWYVMIYKDESQYWRCAYSIKAGRKTDERVAFGDTWISALEGALEGMRLAIPESEERDWKTPEGLESWCILPRVIPISWGYDLYHRISRMSDDAEKEFEADVERRRLVWEGRRKRREDDGQSS